MPSYRATKVLFFSKGAKRNYSELRLFHQRKIGIVSAVDNPFIRIAVRWVGREILRVVVAFSFRTFF